MMSCGGTSFLGKGLRLVTPALGLWALVASCDTYPRGSKGAFTSTSKNAKAAALDDNGEPVLTACGRTLGPVCRRARYVGTEAGGEFGVSLALVGRFDRDPVPDLFVTSRVTPRGQPFAVVSAATGEVLVSPGSTTFGANKTVTMGPDVDGDGHGDFWLASALPSKPFHAMVSSKDERRLWRLRVAPYRDSLPVVAADENGDGVQELWILGVGGKDSPPGLLLLDGKTGSVERRVALSFSPGERLRIADATDADNDGVTDLLIQSDLDVYAVSGATGALLGTYRDRVAQEAAPAMSAAFAGDMNADGKQDVIACFPQDNSAAQKRQGGCMVFSGKDTSMLWTWQRRQIVEGYGLSLAAVGDLNSDGHADIAIGAPFYRSGELENAGRFEVRSGKDGSIFAEAIGETEKRALGWDMVFARRGSVRGARGLWVSAPFSTEEPGPHTGSVELYEF